MPLIILDELNELQIAEGILARAVTADNVTVAHVNIKAGAVVPNHQHIHEQIVNVIEGELELTVDGDKHLLTPGKVMVLPPNIPHSGRAVTEVKVIDVFYPIREDFQGTSFAGYPQTDK